MGVYESAQIYNIVRDGLNYEDAEVRITVGPEALAVPGLQPFMFKAPQGALFLQAQLPYPSNYPLPEKNRFPGLPGSAVSRDGGRSWTPWPSPRPQQGTAFAYEGAACGLADGRSFLIEWIADAGAGQDEPVLRYWISSDNLATWTGPFEARFRVPGIKLDGHDDGGHPYAGLTFHRTLLQLPDGGLLTAAYCWFKEDTETSTYESKMNKFRVILLGSSDLGKTWTFRSVIASGNVGTEGFNENALLHIRRGGGPGRLLCHLRTGRELYECWSDDLGATWTRPAVVRFPGIDVLDVKAWAGLFPEPGNWDLRGAITDPDLDQMGDGTVVGSFGFRVPEKLSMFKSAAYAGNGNFMALSRDGGASWPRIIQLTSGVLTTHYTSVREIEPGLLAVAYDYGVWGQSGIRSVVRQVRVTWKQPQRAHN